MNVNMKLAKPYNCYNLFFILERAKLLEARVIGASNATAPTPSVPAPLTGYEGLDVPPLPTRYEHLKTSLNANWFDPGMNKLIKRMRKHVKSHGLASFREIADTVADNWKVIDPITKMYVETVALILRQRYEELVDTNLFGRNIAIPSIASYVPSKNFTKPTFAANSKQMAQPAPQWSCAKPTKVPEVIMWSSTETVQTKIPDRSSPAYVSDYIKHDTKLASSFQTARRVTLDEDDQNYIPDSTMFCLPVNDDLSTDGGNMKENHIADMCGNLVNDSDNESYTNLFFQPVEIDDDHFDLDSTIFCFPANGNAPSGDQVCTKTVNMDRKRPQKVDISDNDILSYYHSI